MSNKSKISAEALEKKFDAGEDVDAHINWAKAKVARPRTRKLKVAFPENLLDALDSEAARLGVSRESLIRFWIGQRLARPV